MRDKVVEMDQPSEQHESGADAVSISLGPILGAEADHLLVLSDEYMASLYPAESNHLVSSESLRTGDATIKTPALWSGFCRFGVRDVPPTGNGLTAVSGRRLPGV